MAKLGLTAMVAAALALVAMAATLARAGTDGPEKVDAWFTSLCHAKHKTAGLHFYFHNTLSGEKPTAVRVTEKFPTLFRLVDMMDDPLTKGPKPESPLVGRAQVFYALAGLDSLGLHISMGLAFTSPEYKGSTLSIVGHNLVFETYWEMSIVGGTSIFRLASGIATAKTYFFNLTFNLTNGDAVVEYKVIAMHY